MSKINLTEYYCAPTDKEYIKLYKKFLKDIIPKNINKSKNPICKIYMGPPGSGKSILIAKDKNYVNINADIIISQLPELVELFKKNIKHSNMIESCNELGDSIARKIENYCIKKKYNISTEILYGPDIDFVYYLTQNNYQIKSYYVYAYDAYKNNIKRKMLNLSKKIYLLILDDMHNYKNIFIAFNCSHSFKFVCYGKKSTPKSWSEVEKKITKILDKIRKQIK